MKNKRKVFFKLSQPPNTICAEWAKGKVISGMDNICPKFGDKHFLGNLRGGDLVIDLPFSNVCNFIWTCYSELLITNNTLKIFQDEKLTGFKIKSVKIHKIKKKTDRFAPILWEVIVIGKGGDADPACGIKLKYKCDYCKYRVYSPFNDNGIIVDPNNWDGSDFFTVNGYPKFIFVTDKVKKIVENNKLTGVFFIPTDEIFQDDFFKKFDVKIIEQE